jgi:hypothetical protein
MKKNLFLFALGLLTFMPAQAQQWGNRKTPSTFDMESAKRKMQMELHFLEPATTWQFRNIKCK